jgi:hypothetical protein
MKAHVGDRIVVASPTTGRVARDGEVLEVRGRDSGPPYLVRWTDTGSTGLFYPGPDAHVSGVDEVAPGEPAPTPMHGRSWRVDIELVEAGQETSAHAVLVAERPAHLDARGEAHRNPGDVAVPAIGDEVAVARALRQLADRLLETASSDLSGIEGRDVTLTR